MHEHYILMHKQFLCGVIDIDPVNGSLRGYNNLSTATSPFFGNADTSLMKRWWEARAIPTSRNSINEILTRAGCRSTKEYLAKNLALSLTDTYWICPVDWKLKWEDVSLYRMQNINEGRIPYHNATSYDPNATLGGQMDKYWDMNDTPPTLVKTAYRTYGQQAVNEVFATLVHDRQRTQLPYVRYEIQKAPDNGIQSLCPAFTSEEVEFVPAMEVIDSRKIRGDKSLYDAYIDICSEHGIERDLMQQFMDYQTLTDFVISNTDEHLMNFGILRTTDELTCIAPAPIFDSGNSMFYSELRNSPYSRRELLERKITGIYDVEEKILKRVKDKNIVREDLLPHPGEVKDFYAERGIPEERASVIAGSYEQKLSLLHDFQRGKTISLYNEKHKHAKARSLAIE